MMVMKSLPTNMKKLQMPLPDRIRLRREFDSPVMAAEVDALLVGDWIKHFVTQNYEGDWSVIPLRGPSGAEHPVMMIYSDPTCSSFVDTPYLDHCPAIQRALDTFKCPLLAVRLMRLGPGSIIKEHCDHDLDFEQGTVRLHIPVTTNDKVAFRLNGELVALVAGSCWYLRLSDRHAVSNGGTTDRVHLVIDASVNGWLEEELRNGSSS